ncbi:peptidylprolyl isomerase [Cyanobium sp. HWJ4-Hawea]|uniref:peptidylprolyl isomerase n=1 Tax=Cyanobium sp. HWJ4-Hawea TaxID=2823713 RepID=UPI0020CC0806|nr:peptidylprolyl isomerase [Cyanobium sp. HWJ4-Hawea]MCP9809132.1 peptidylprolyl isomerase [Cyanobium sp. HWJ4-Hawea]
MQLPFPDQQCWPLLRRSGRARAVLEAWLEECVCAQVPLEPEREAELLEAFQADPAAEPLDLPFAATRQERLKLFKHSAFLLQVDEHFSRTKTQRDRLIYSMLRCHSASRVAELALAIREGEIDFATAAIRWSEGPESASGGRIGPIHPDAGHPELNTRLANASEGQLVGPFPVGDMHVLLRLDTRISIHLDEQLQNQLIEELYCLWLDRQIGRLLLDEKIEPIEYLAA